MTLLGLDSCAGGWAVAAADPGSAVVRFYVVADVGVAVEEARKAEALIAVDMPIGLPSSSMPRACDLQARKTLGKGQGSRVFPAPTRQSLRGSTYEECCELNLAASGKSLSRQTYAIIAKIKHLDRRMTPGLQQHMREMHPEVTFRTVNGATLQHAKDTKSGREERLDLLKRNGLVFDPLWERRWLGLSRVQLDDLLDAAAGLLTARRMSAGRAVVLGDDVRDDHGLRMEIVA